MREFHGSCICLKGVLSLQTTDSYPHLIIKAGWSAVGLGADHFQLVVLCRKSYEA